MPRQNELSRKFANWPASKRVELSEAVELAERGDFDGAMAIVASRCRQA